MVQQQSSAMGEDRTTTCTERRSHDVVSPCRRRHSSVISSCSDDAESESTSAGYPSTPDEEKEEELEYGPGIVNKLKTRYLSIALKQNRGTNMRRSCSMENLLDQDRPSQVTNVDPRMGLNGVSKSALKEGNLKRAKSMDTLLMDLQAERQTAKELIPQVNGNDKKEPKIIRRVDGGLNRTLPMICDEELPKPDTVKTYKRMFEPAESRRGSHCRRPPVLRASAKSVALAASKSNGVLSSPSAKVNGVSMKNKVSAKQSPLTKVQSNGEVVNGVNGNVKKSPVKEPSRPLYNGCHVPKYNPVKKYPTTIRDNRNIEKEFNTLIRLMNHKEVDITTKADVICNGNSNHKEDSKNNGQDKIVNHVKCNGVITNSKPKIPPNRPALRSPKPLPRKPTENGTESQIAKLKTSPMNGIQKTPEKPEIIPKQELKVETSPLHQVKNVEEAKPPEVTKLKDVLSSKEPKSAIPEKTIPQIPEDPKSDKPVVLTPVKKTESSVLVNSDDRKVLNVKKTDCPDTPVKPELKSPVKKLSPAPSSTSMVFDFRGKDVVPHVAVLPVPFGCKSLHPKKRPILIDGKECPNSNGTATDEEDEEYVDYSIPPPSGVTFEGENVKIGRGSILSTRNKDLKITFDDDIDSNTFVYPSESSLLEDPERSVSPNSTRNEIIPNGQPPPTPLKSNTSLGTSGLSNYTPSVLRTMDNFEPGMFRPPPAPVLPEKEEENRKEGEEEENTEIREEAEDPEMLKPADPGIISSWSLSADTSDLLF